MAIDRTGSLRGYSGTWAEVSPSIEGAKAPNHQIEYGCRLVGLSGAADLDGLSRGGGAETISPFLLTLADGERFGLEVVIEDGHTRIGFSGTASGFSAEEAETRGQKLSSTLVALVSSQLPDFVTRQLVAAEMSTSTLVHEVVITPRGRRSGADRLKSQEPRPRAVGEPAAGVLLPVMALRPERIRAAIAVLRACTQPARLRLDMTSVALDASALRQLALARERLAQGEPHSTLATMRLLALSIPDDALMTAFLDDGLGVRLTLTVATAQPLDRADLRMLCHALFGTEPSGNKTRADLNLADIYPRRYALPLVITGLAGAAAESLRRPTIVYKEPESPGHAIGHALDGRVVEVSDRDRAMHTLVIGATGTGKSTALLNQLVRDMAVGHGALLIDPHGDLFEAARRLVPRERKKDLLVAHLGDPAHAFTMNVLAGLGGDPLAERSATINGLLRLFKHTIWPGVPEAFGPMFELYFRNALMLQMGAERETATILGVERVFQDDAYRNELLERCDDPHTVDFWRKTANRIDHHEIEIKNIAPYIIAKLSPFTSNTLLRPILGSTTSNLDLRAAIATGKIVLVNLAKGLVGEGSARLIGGLITMRLVASAQAQMQLPEGERREFMTVLDEFQTYASEHLAEALEETRKYKLRLTLACQSLGQVDGNTGRANVARSIVANVANLVAFRLGVEDAGILARYFEPGFTPQDMIYLPNHVAVARLLSGGQALPPLQVNMASMSGQ